MLHRRARSVRYDVLTDILAQDDATGTTELSYAVARSQGEDRHASSAGIHLLCSVHEMRSILR